MKKEIVYRVVRIMFVITILLLGSFLRNDVKESYKQSKDMLNNLTTSLQLTKINEKILNKNNILTSSYYLEVSNSTNIEKPFSFIVTKENEKKAYETIKYQIIKDNELLEEGYLNKETIYTGVKKPNSEDVYEIKFLIDKSIIKEENFLAKITLI